MTMVKPNELHSGGQPSEFILSAQTLLQIRAG